MELTYVAVDDEPIFLKELNSILKSYPFLKEIDSIDDSFEAADIINNKRPNVVFLDHDMPGMNGKDVLKEINYKADVVFVTSNFKPIQDVINHDGIANIEAYLSKPLDKEELKRICLKLRKAGSELDKTSYNGKISIPNGKKDDYYIDSSKLSYVKANGKYTDWHFTDSAAIRGINLQMKNVRLLLDDKNVDYAVANKSFIVFENGIVKKHNKDIIVISNGEEIEISMTADGFVSWLKSKFR